MSLGIYVEVLQRWIGDLASVSAAGRVFTTERKGYHIQIPEQLDVLVEFSDNATGTLKFSNVYTGKPEESLEIVGSRDTLLINFLTNEIKTGSDLKVLVPPPEHDRPWRVEQDFIEAVHDPSKPRPHPNFYDGLRYMQVVDAVHLSLTEKRRVAVPIPNGGSH